MSMEMLEDRGSERDYALERLIMLSDGVFAIAITLLALELRPPQGWEAQTLAGLWSLMWRPFSAFLFSFVFIAVYWIAHRRMFGRLRSADLPLTLLNFVLLGLITLAPVMTNMFYEGGPKSVGFVLYAVLLATIGFANGAAWGWAALGNPALLTHRPPLTARLFSVTSTLVMPVVMILLLVASLKGLTWPYVAAVLLAIFMAVIRRRIDGRLDARVEGPERQQA